LPEQGESHAVESGNTGGVGVARATAATFGEKDDGKSHVFDNGEESVFLSMVEITLGSGQHCVVVRRNGNRDTVDGGDATHQAVSGGVGNEILETASLALCCDGKRAKLAKRTGIDEVGDVLARRALAALMAAGNSLGAGGVGGQMSALLVGGKVAALGGICRRVVRVIHDHGSGCDAQECLALFHRVTHGNEKFGNDPVDSCADGVFHLHRFDREDLPGCGHGVARQCGDGHHRSEKWRVNVDRGPHGDSLAETRRGVVEAWVSWAT